MLKDVFSELDELRFGEGAYPITENTSPYLLVMLISELKRMNFLLEGLVKK